MPSSVEVLLRWLLLLSVMHSVIHGLDSVTTVLTFGAPGYATCVFQHTLPVYWVELAL